MLILVPVSVTTLAQRSISPSTNACVASGVSPPGSTPRLPSFSFTAGCASALTISACSRRHDLLRHAGGARDAEPVGADELRKALLGHGRNIREGRAALRTADRDRAHDAVAHVRRRRRQAVEHRFDAAAEQILGRGLRAAIRHMNDIDAAGDLEEFTGQVMQGADPAGAVIQLAGPLLRQRHVVLEVARPAGRCSPASPAAGGR